MGNIPTELLRTFVTVIDEGSFTRAAHALRITQPAVSSHIKKLQTILGSDLIDRSGHGLAPTPKGELVLTYARRLLSINDLILQVGEPGRNAHMIRLGMPEDFVGGQFTGLLA